MKKEAGDEVIERIIKCKDCGVEFNFTVGERRFLQEKIDEHKFLDEDLKVRTEIRLPIRCEKCRADRKAFFNQNK